MRWERNWWGAVEEGFGFGFLLWCLVLGSCWLRKREEEEEGDGDLVLCLFINIEKEREFMGTFLQAKAQLWPMETGRW